MDDGVAEAGVGAAQRLGDVGVARGEALDVDLVDDGLDGGVAAGGRRPSRRTG